MIDRLFDRLDDWRNLPAYRMEQRADMFFFLYLREALEARLGIRLDETIIPELPVRLGNLKEHGLPLKGGDDQSKKIDYVFFSSNRMHAYSVELKTDDASRNSSQDAYLNAAPKIGMPPLITGLIKIRDKSTQKLKYERLLEKLELLRQVEKIDGKWKCTSKVHKWQLLYVQPNLKNSDTPDQVITFNWLADHLEEKHKDDALALRFAKSLRKWASVAAGTKQTSQPG